MEYVFTATETGTPSGNEAEAKALLHMLDATEDGIELFVLDDGWFGTRNDDHQGLGDWFSNREKTSRWGRGIIS